MIKNDALPFFTFDNFFYERQKKLSNSSSTELVEFSTHRQVSKNLIKQDMNLARFFWLGHFVFSISFSSTESLVIMTYCWVKISSPLGICDGVTVRDIINC